MVMGRFRIWLRTLCENHVWPSSLSRLPPRLPPLVVLSLSRYAVFSSRLKSWLWVSLPDAKSHLVHLDVSWGGPDVDIWRAGDEDGPVRPQVEGQGCWCLLMGSYCGTFISKMMMNRLEQTRIKKTKKQYKPIVKETWTECYTKMRPSTKSYECDAALILK